MWPQPACKFLSSFTTQDNYIITPHYNGISHLSKYQKRKKNENKYNNPMKLYLSNNKIILQRSDTLEDS